MIATQRRTFLFEQRFLLSVIILLALSAPATGAKHYDLMVQGAVDGELQPLLSALQGRKLVQIDAWTFWTGRIGDKSVVISPTEVGPLNAAAATAVGIRFFQPGAVINQGTAGGHNRELKLWDIVIGEHSSAIPNGSTPPTRRLPDSTAPSSCSSLSAVYPGAR